MLRHLSSSRPTAPRCITPPSLFTSTAMAPWATPPWISSKISSPNPHWCGRWSMSRPVYSIYWVCWPHSASSACWGWMSSCWRCPCCWPTSSAPTPPNTMAIFTTPRHWFPTSQWPPSMACTGYCAFSARHRCLPDCCWLFHWYGCWHGRAMCTCRRDAGPGAANTSRSPAHRITSSSSVFWPKSLMMRPSPPPQHCIRISPTAATSIAFPMVSKHSPRPSPRNGLCWM